METLFELFAFFLLFWRKWDFSTNVTKTANFTQLLSVFDFVFYFSKVRTHRNQTKTIRSKHQTVREYVLKGFFSGAFKNSSRKWSNLTKPVNIVKTGERVKDGYQAIHVQCIEKYLHYIVSISITHFINRIVSLRKKYKLKICLNPVTDFVSKFTSALNEAKYSLQNVFPQKNHSVVKEVVRPVFFSNE